MNYEEFRLEYEKQHPASIPARSESTQGDYPAWLRFVVLSMFLSSALISGVHTVPTVYDGIEIAIAPLIRAVAALGSFVAIELSFFVSPFAQLHGDRSISRIGLFVSFGIALAANINSVLKAMSSSQLTPLTVVVALFFGIGVPVLAFTSGALFVKMHIAASTLASQDAEIYRQACKEFDAVILTAFRKYCKENDVSARSQVHSVNSLNEQSEPDGRNYSANSSSGYSKRMDAKTVIHEWLSAHPDRMNDRLDDLLNAIEDESGVKVGRTSIHNVRKEMMNGNGHFENGVGK